MNWVEKAQPAGFYDGQGNRISPTAPGIVSFEKYSLRKNPNGSIDELIKDAHKLEKTGGHPHRRKIHP